MENKITDIHCPQCGAPAEFNIVRQQYLCEYCGGKFEAGIAQEEKIGFRKLQGDKLKDSVRKYRLFRASCSGCGASVLFEENEALSKCAFCGRSLVRSEYMDAEDMPESVIPFGITEAEARDRLAAWCRENKGKREAKKLLPLLSELKGFYLPYELVRGPVHMQVSRMDCESVYPCEGFMTDEFVNRSKQLDNLLLDAMEPFDISALTPFDFAYVAGHRVKILDISDTTLEARVSTEASESYAPYVRKTLETKAVEVSADVSSAVRLPVLLPVYYICQGNLMAAVNGQTGKVSVRAEKVSHYFFLPWWLKAILSTLVLSGLLFGALALGGMSVPAALVVTGMVGFIFLIVTLCLFSDTLHNRFSVESGRKIFTSGEESCRREKGRLVARDSAPERSMAEPVFLRSIKGTVQPVILRFTTPSRIIRMILLTIIGLFLPVILALLINGFDFQRVELGGSAVWFCIAVPTVPIFLLKFGIVQLYERPWIYTVTADGKKKRYKPKREFRITKSTVKDILCVLFVPPVSLAVWFGIISFFVMVYLTAFGFD